MCAQQRAGKSNEAMYVEQIYRPGRQTNTLSLKRQLLYCNTEGNEREQEKGGKNRGGETEKAEGREGEKERKKKVNHLKLILNVSNNLYQTPHAQRDKNFNIC